MAGGVAAAVAGGGNCAGDSVGGVWDVYCDVTKGAFSDLALRWMGAMKTR